MHARVLKRIDLQSISDGAGPELAIRQAAPWHGFRLASNNEAPLASAFESHVVADEDAKALDRDPEDSLPWVGRLACWMSALFTATLIILAAT